MPTRVGSVDLLWAGVAAPVLFTTVYLIEGARRAGYDPLRHQVSLLSLGSDGWIQIASFLVTGALLVVFAIGLRARLEGGPGVTGVPAGIGIMGAGFVVAGVFTTQPMFGFPPGAPAGLSTEITLTSVLHLLGAILLLVGSVTAALLYARRDRRAGSTGWAVASLAVAVIVVVFFGAAGGGPSGELLFPELTGALQRISLVAAMAWVAAIALRGLSGRPL